VRDRVATRIFKNPKTLLEKETKKAFERMVIDPATGKFTDPYQRSTLRALETQRPVGGSLQAIMAEEE
jgi:hypothetical protein